MCAAKRQAWNANPSNTDFSLEDFHSQKKRKSPQSRWNIGNAKKRRQLVKKFFDTSTVHGTHFINPKKNTSWLLKFIYRVIFLICILAVLASVSMLLQDTFGSESTFIGTINKDIKLGKEEDPEYFPDYPQITICRQSYYRTDLNESYLKLVEYAFLALGYPYVPLTPEEISMVIDISMKDNKTRLSSHVLEFEDRLNQLEERFKELKISSESFDLKQFVLKNSMRCKDFLAICVAMEFPLDCCKIFKPILTNMGLCYTLVDTSDILRIIRSSPKEFSLSIDIISPPLPIGHTAEGFNLYLSHPLEVPVFFKPEEGQRLLPTILTHLKVRLVKTDRNALYTDWTALTNSCPKWPSGVNPLKEGSNLYTYHDCDTVAHFVYLRNTCKCESIFFPGKATMRYCEPRDLYICFPRNAFRSSFTTPTKVCSQPCISYQYKREAAIIRVGNINVGRVKIIYDSRQFVNHEYRTTTMSSLFSQIGGSLGLYLGASIITVMEIIMFVASWLWYRICPSRKIKVYKEPAFSINTRDAPTAMTKRYF